MHSTALSTLPAMFSGIFSINKSNSETVSSFFQLCGTERESEREREREERDFKESMKLGNDERYVTYLSAVQNGVCELGMYV